MIEAAISFQDYVDCIDRHGATYGCKLQRWVTKNLKRSTDEVVKIGSPKVDLIETTKKGDTTQSFIAGKYINFPVTFSDGVTQVARFR